MRVDDDSQEPLSVYTDGASRGNPGKAAIAYSIYDAGGSLIENAARCIGTHTNNEAEYEAVLWGIEKVRERRCTSVRAFTDSELVAKQYTGEYRTKDARMAQYAKRVAANKGLFESFDLRHVPRENPRMQLVDSMVNEALDRQDECRGPKTSEESR